MSQRCNATTKSGRACRAWAVAGTDPPRCAAHGGARATTHWTKSDPPTAERLRQDPPSKCPKPPETIGDALEHLARNLARLTDFIERHADELSVDEMARLSGVLGLNLARYTRMQRDQAALEEGAAQELEADIEAALRLASERLGIDLRQA